MGDNILIGPVASVGPHKLHNKVLFTNKIKSIPLGGNEALMIISLFVGIKKIKKYIDNYYQIDYAVNRSHQNIAEYLKLNIMFMFG